MVKRLVTVIGIAYLWFALGFSTYAQGNEISQISVKMPEVKVYLNQSIEGNEEIRAFLSEKELFYQNVDRYRGKIFMLIKKVLQNCPKI